MKKTTVKSTTLKKGTLTAKSVKFESTVNVRKIIRPPPPMILNGDNARPADMGAAIIRVYTN